MINVTYKKYGLMINAIWFCGDVNEIEKQNKADFIFLHGIRNNVMANSFVSSQYTLITDLKESKENIFKRIDKNCRYEINRAEKEATECIVFKADDFKNDPAILDIFKGEYDNFTRLKGIQNTYNACAMEQYIENNNVILTKAFKNNVNYAQHIYLCDKENARLLHSVSNFRIKELDHNLVGRANKYLHWNDILYLQEHKFKTLDWGGVSSVISPNGVDKFKKEFKGHLDEYYNVIIGNSLLGRAAILIKKVKQG